MLYAHGNLPAQKTREKKGVYCTGQALHPLSFAQPFSFVSSFFALLNYHECIPTSPAFHLMLYTDVVVLLLQITVYTWPNQHKNAQLALVTLLDLHETYLRCRFSTRNNYFKVTFVKNIFFALEKHNFE